MTKVEITRQKILMTALRLIIKNERIPTMREIASEADMGLGSLYYHFKAINEIFIELDSMSLHHIAETVKRRLGEDQDSLTQFMAVDIYRLIFLSSREVYRLLTSSLLSPIQFSEARLSYLADALKNILGHADDFCVHTYSGQFLAINYRVISDNNSLSIRELMRNHYLYFFQSMGVDRETIERALMKTIQLGNLILRQELAIPWPTSLELGLRDTWENLPICSFDVS